MSPRRGRALGFALATLALLLAGCQTLGLGGIDPTSFVTAHTLSGQISAGMLAQGSAALEAADASLASSAITDAGVFNLTLPTSVPTRDLYLPAFLTCATKTLTVQPASQGMLLTDRLGAYQNSVRLGDLQLSSDDLNADPTQRTVTSWWYVPQNTVITGTCALSTTTTPRDLTFNLVLQGGHWNTVLETLTTQQDGSQSITYASDAPGPNATWQFLPHPNKTPTVRGTIQGYSGATGQMGVIAVNPITAFDVTTLWPDGQFVYTLPTAPTATQDPHDAFWCAGPSGAPALSPASTTVTTFLGFDYPDASSGGPHYAIRVRPAPSGGAATTEFWVYSSNPAIVSAGSCQDDHGPVSISATLAPGWTPLDITPASSGTNARPTTITNHLSDDGFAWTQSQ